MSPERAYSEQLCRKMVWLVHAGFLNSFPLRLPDDLAEHPEQEGVRLLRNKSGRFTAHVAGGGLGGGDAIVKRYWPRSWVEFIKYLFVCTRAAAEWRTNNRFQALGIPTATALAWGERRSCGIWMGSELVLQAISPHLTLAGYLEEGPPAAEAAAVARDLAVHVANLHNQGFYYRDLHGENILLQRRNGKPPAVFFIDLHEVRQVRTVSRWMCVDDLGRLNGYVKGNRRLRIRFLKAYLAHRECGHKDWKQLLKDVDRRTREIWDRFYRKRGRKIETY